VRKRQREREREGRGDTAKNTFKHIFTISWCFFHGKLF
jgi:hypothetical protein